MAILIYLFSFWAIQTTGCNFHLSSVSLSDNSSILSADIHGIIYIFVLLLVVSLSEYMPGGNLYDFLHKQKNNLDLTMVLRIAIGISKGMDYLHQNNIVHRDLKTANLLLGSDHVCILFWIHVVTSSWFIKHWQLVCENRLWRLQTLESQGIHLKMEIWLLKLVPIDGWRLRCVDSLLVCSHEKLILPDQKHCCMDVFTIMFSRVDIFPNWDVQVVGVEDDYF